MKLVTFTHQNTAPRCGVVTPNQQGVIDLARASNGKLPADMKSLLEAGPAAMALVGTLHAEPQAVWLPLADVTLQAPVLNPQKIMAIGRNYAAHAHEQKVEPPKNPVIFAKYPTSINGPDQPIQWYQADTQQVDFEGELAVVIGKTGYRVPEAEALSYVAGYTLCNDVSARDMQFGDKQYTRGKSLNTFCPMGPWLVTADEIPNPQALHISTKLNGELMQSAPTSRMIFSVAHLIAFMTRAFTILPGDIISTGTPAGVGVFREPPIFMQHGDEVVVEIEEIGQLRNTCKIIDR